MTSFDIDKLLREDLLGFAPYTTSAVSVAEMEHVVKLDANENPFGPSPRALAALADTRVWNRYATQDELRPLIASYAGVEPAHIVVGNGADEVIDLVQRIFLQQGDAIINFPPTFEMYDKYAAVNGARVLDLPRRDDFSIDVEAVERAVRQGRTKIIFLANPNNPDGSVTRTDEIERLLALPALVVIDEAYAEFSGESLARRVPEQDNLVVLRTFSKWAGLAGLRIGYAIAPLRIADQIMRTKSPYNVNVAAIVAARASLADREYLLENVRRIVQERERLMSALSALPFLHPFPSHTNFILCRVAGRAPGAVRDALAQKSILIRAFGSPRLATMIRISVGTPEQNDAVVRALASIA